MYVCMYVWCLHVLSRMWMLNHMHARASPSTTTASACSATFRALVFLWYSFVRWLSSVLCFCSVVLLLLLLLLLLLSALSFARVPDCDRGPCCKLRHSVPHSLARSVSICRFNAPPLMPGAPEPKQHAREAAPTKQTTKPPICDALAPRSPRRVLESNS